MVNPCGAIDERKGTPKATGVRVAVAVDAIRQIYSPGARGAFTERAALQQILEGTGLTARFTSVRF